MNENVKVEVKGDKLILTVDLTKDLGVSSTGKTNLVAKCREVLTGGIVAQLNVFKKTK